MATNITMYRGDTQTIALVVTRNAAAVDLTGAKLWMTAKSAYADADPGVFQLSSPSSGITITNAAQGRATAVIANSNTSGLSSAGATLYYDVQLLEADGTITTIATGTITVSPDVTTATS